MMARVMAARGWIVPAILATVAALQFCAAQMGGLSAWKGGGFGMFSTVDSPGSRFLRVALLTGGSRVLVPVPRELARAASEARTWPTEARLAALARPMVRGRWVPAAIVPVAPSPAALMIGPFRMQRPDEPPAAAIDAQAVLVELWKADFHSAECRIVAFPLQRMRLERSDRVVR